MPISVPEMTSNLVKHLHDGPLVCADKRTRKPGVKADNQKLSRMQG